MSGLKPRRQSALYLVVPCLLPSLSPVQARPAQGEEGRPPGGGPDWREAVRQGGPGGEEAGRGRQTGYDWLGWM